LGLVLAGERAVGVWRCGEDDNCFCSICLRELFDWILASSCSRRLRISASNNMIASLLLDPVLLSETIQDANTKADQNHHEINRLYYN
jgi:hypothetical protein